MATESDIVTTCLTLVQNLTADGCAEKQSLDKAKASLDQARPLVLLTAMTSDGSKLTISAEKGLTATCSIKSDLTALVSDTYTVATDSNGNYAATVKLTNGKTQDFVWLKGEAGKSGKDNRKEKKGEAPGASWYYDGFKPGGFKVWGGSSAGVSGSATGVSAAVTGASLGASVVSISFSGATVSAWLKVVKAIARYYSMTAFELDFINLDFWVKVSAACTMLFRGSVRTQLNTMCATNSKN